MPPVKIAGIRKRAALRSSGVAPGAATATDLPLGARDRVVQPVERAEFEGVDYGWVMQTTFVLTIVVGAPVVAVLSAFVTLDSWGARAAFAVRVGAPIWFTTAVAVALYARRTDAGDGGAETDGTGEVEVAKEHDTGEVEVAREDDTGDVESDEADGAEAGEVEDAADS